MFRQNTYQEGDFYRLIPVARQAVVPGQSVTIDASVCWESAAFTRNVLNGGLASLMAFYVPYRLVWDEWVDFISDPQSTATPPTSTVSWPTVFEYAKAGLPAVTFGRRALKLIYNQYFGSDQYGTGVEYWYADITNDAQVEGRNLRTNDQFLGRLMEKDIVPSENFISPVTGTAPNQIATTDLNAFRQAMKEARSDRRSTLSGDKYVDAMRRMGVQLDWKIQNAPEFLGSSSIDFDSKETRATYTPSDPVPAGAAQVGRAYARYSEKMKLSTPRKFFAEHGLVMTVLVVRPFTFPAAAGSQDVYEYARSGYFLGDNQTGVSEGLATALGATAESNFYAPRFTYLSAGSNIVGNQSAVPWYVSNAAGSLGQLVWPDPSVPQDTNLTQDFAVYTRYKAMGPTPVKSVTF